MRTEVRVEIAAPATRVWEVVSDVECWPEWTPSVRSIRRLDEGPLRVGSRARVRQPRLPTTAYTVTDIAAGRSFTWVATGPGVRTTGTHRVDPTASGSVATLTLEQDGPVGRLVGRLSARLTSRYVSMEAAGLRTRSERPDA